MQALKRLSLALVVGALGIAVTACGEDGDKPSPRVPTVDAGAVDSGTTVQDSGTGTAMTRPCTSYTPVANGKCGGSHCTQTEAELKASAVANATCGSDVAIKSFCSLEAVNVVAACTLSNIGASQNGDAAFSMAIADCSKKNPTVGSADFGKECLNCFVDSAKCAATNCLIQCAANPNTPECDECRIEKGCISSFYKCAGITNPLDLLEAALADGGVVTP